AKILRKDKCWAMTVVCRKLPLARGSFADFFKQAVTSASTVVATLRSTACCYAALGVLIDTTVC
ncbi:MAG: hypothetical protein Q7T76_06315, partial [Ferruginibacter sp.]|nr:hypothetical protein [Ferruginibacter sp.]